LRTAPTFGKIAKRSSQIDGDFRTLPQASNLPHSGRKNAQKMVYLKLRLFANYFQL